MQMETDMEIIQTELGQMPSLVMELNGATLTKTAMVTIQMPSRSMAVSGKIETVTVLVTIQMVPMQMLSLMTQPDGEIAMVME